VTTRQVSTAQRIAGVSGAVLLASMWLTWYGTRGGMFGGFLDEAGLDTSRNAWQAFRIVDLVLFATAIAAIAFAVTAATATRRGVTAVPAQWVAAAGGVSVLLILYRIVEPPGLILEGSPRPGAFVGLLAAIGVALGGWRAMQEAADRQEPGRAAPGPENKP
jgi:hypothetical protein